jgi:putative membrane protein
MMRNNNRSSEINTAVKVALLLGFAAFYIVSMLTGSVSLYVHPRMIPFMIFAAVVMVIIAAVYFIKHIDPGTKSEGLRPLLLFVAALIMAWAFPAQTFDAGTGTAGAPQLSAADGVSARNPIFPRAGGRRSRHVSGADGENADGAAISASEEDGGDDGASGSTGHGGTLVFDQDNYYENLYNIYKDLDAFVGRDVELTGFVFKDSDTLQGDEFVAARLLMVCCAADMQTVGLLCR